MFSWARELYELCWNDNICDDFSKLQALAYLSLLQGSFDMQKERYDKSIQNFIKANVIYSSMIDIFGLDEFSGMNDDDDDDDNYDEESDSKRGKRRKRRGKGKKKNKNQQRIYFERRKEYEYYVSQMTDINKRLKFLQKAFGSEEGYNKLVKTIETKFLEIIGERIESVRSKYGVKKEEANEDETEEDATLEMKSADSERKKEFKEVRENTIEINGTIGHIHNKYLQKWINQFRKQLNQMTLECMGNKNSKNSKNEANSIHQRRMNVMRCIEILNGCIKNANFEIKKNSGNNSSKHDEYLIIRDYCTIHCMRLEIIKNYLWFENTCMAILNTNDKLSFNVDYPDFKRIKIYELAKVCEKEQELIDEFMNNSSNTFTKCIINERMNDELRLLKAYFDIFQWFYTSQIYYFNDDTSSCYNVGSELLETKLNQFKQLISSFKYPLIWSKENKDLLTKWGDYDSCFYISCITRMDNINDKMDQLSNWCHKLLILTKAKHVLGNSIESKEDNQVE